MYTYCFEIMINLVANLFHQGRHMSSLSSIFSMSISTSLSSLFFWSLMAAILRRSRMMLRRTPRVVWGEVSAGAFISSPVMGRERSRRFGVEARWFEVGVERMDAGETGGEYANRFWFGTWMLNGEEFAQELRYFTRLCPSMVSTPGRDIRYWHASAAHLPNPAWNFCASVIGSRGLCKRCR